MRLSYRNKSARKLKSRMKKRVRVRKKVFGTSERPRLSVFRSASHIYAQVIDDTNGKTLASASTVMAKANADKSGKDTAASVGAEIAKLVLQKNISAVVFDRGGYLYHGRIKALADAAREAGLKF